MIHLSSVSVMDHGIALPLSVRDQPVANRYNVIFIVDWVFFAFLYIVSFEPSTYTVTEGVDEFVELIIKAENVKYFVAINVSLTSESAKGITHSCLPQTHDDSL